MDKDLKELVELVEKFCFEAEMKLFAFVQQVEEILERINKKEKHEIQEDI